MVKEDKGRVKMTVIHFETESDNATLQANIHSIAQTLSRALSPPARIVRPVQLTSGNGITPSDDLGELNESENYQDAVDADLIAAPVKAKKSGAARQYAKPETIDVDLISGDLPLRTFLERKKPEGDVKRYLAIAFWFKNYLNIGEITMDHAYTAYRHMGWSDVPKDVAWPFREMKKTKYGWIRSGSGRGSYQINHIGEGVVERMGTE